MQQTLEQIQTEATQATLDATSVAALGALRTQFLGKKGALAAIMKEMGKLSPEDRPKMGAVANTVREAIAAAFETAQSRLGAAEDAARLAAETLDVTIPGVRPRRGHRHPMTAVLRDVRALFLGMGFSVAEGPEVETTRYCFDALNTSPDHPARDVQDTFYLPNAWTNNNEQRTDNRYEETNGVDAEGRTQTILRTQTSSVQIRTMEQTKPPIRVISPGRTYRKDKIDATHSPMFHQIEGLVVDKHITMSDLKGTLETLMRGLYGSDAALRFRPHHFPYTEPSAEVDLQCFKCGGAGCRLCKGEGYIEMLGAGMVHPNVLANCGIDPEVYTGFAFGVGLERLTMMRYNITDMRLFFENDIRFLRQFA